MQMKDEKMKIEEEFVQDADEMAALAADQSALVKYVPKSKAPFRLDTLIPRNMAFEVQKALNRVVKINGNIDNYVRNELKYPTTKSLWDGLGAEQVDSIGLYLSQFDREQGIIIADQTGIGKGRQAAAIIRHAKVNGYLPVFFTRKPDLFTDMYRDLKAIGSEDIHPFIVNTGSLARIKDADGNVVFSPLSPDEQYELIARENEFPTDSREAIDWFKKNNKRLPDPEKQPTITLVDTIDYLPNDYDCVFCTYSQIQAASPFKRLWIAKMIEASIEGSNKYKKVVFVLDESHMAGGFDSIIGRWMRSVLPGTKATCYLSATFAKYPEVMPFYAKKTAIQETLMTDGAFVNAMASGGLALQEIVASNLAESGQLIRRQRSNEGILVDYITLDKEPARSNHRDRVNRVVKLMNDVVAFERDYIEPIMSDIHSSAKADGEQLENKPKGLGVKQAPYFSRVFNIVDQMLFSLKVEEVANQAIELLNQNKKVVIAFKSTMGAFLKDLNLTSGDVVVPEQLDFVRTLIKGLDSVFNYNYTDIGGEKTREKIELEELPADGIARYHEIKKAMLAESSGLTISPIDKLIQIIENTSKKKRLGGHDGDKFTVAEVTGRNQRIRFEDDGAIVQSFRSDTEKYFRLFNKGDYDVLLINQSGSTGSSAHASKDFEDQRVRAMIIHQFELDINTEVQKRGRINRTGQVVLPEYYYITSSIPAEQRLMTMLKGKLKSLDANTTGSQKTNDDTLKSADFFNKYGDKVAWDWISENTELAEKMGNPTYSYDKSQGRFVRVDSKTGTMKQLTGRAGLLTVEEQDELYKDLLVRYEFQIEWEKQRGTYDLEIEFLKLDADVKKRFLFQKGNGGKTPFGKDTVRDEAIVNNLKKPFTKDELEKRMADSLSGKKPEIVKTELVNEIQKEYPSIVEELKKGRLNTIEKIQKDLDELPDYDSGKDEQENEKIDANRRRLEELISQKRDALGGYEHELGTIENYIIKGVGHWNIGDIVKVPILGTEITSWGVYLGVKIGKAKNPYKLSNVSLIFAVADSRKIIEYNLTAEQRREINNIFAESKDLKEEETKQILPNWNELIKESSGKRERRYILTENIVGASNQIGTSNKLIKYNTNDGAIKNGIILHRDYGKEDHERKALIPISNALGIINNLSIDELFSDHQLRVKFKHIQQGFYQLFIGKKGGFDLYTDKILRSLIMRSKGQSNDELADFVQNAGDMTATLHVDKLERFLKRLDSFGLLYLGHAKELEDWEIENEQDWQKKTKSKDGERHAYKLSRPYGQGSNPVLGFQKYKEPDATYPYGVVEYNRVLSDTEKYNYSLVPIFANVEQPYTAWKSYVASTVLKKEFAQILKDAKNEPLHEAILTLGYFITNNPHEDGNTEFVFGDYTEDDLGRAAYEDHFGLISGLDELISQLTIELSGH